MTDAGHRSAIELLHPDGIAGRALHPGDLDPGGMLDVIETADGSSATAELLRERLAPDGVAYLRGGHDECAAFARYAGLDVGPAVIELDRMLVPTERYALRFAAATRIVSSQGRLAARIPFGSMTIAARAPATIARRRGARPLGDWIRRLVRGAAVVTMPTAAFVLGRGGLLAVAKLGATSASRRELAEADALTKLGPSARAAGADVPVPIQSLGLNGRPVLLETGVEGRAASVALAASPVQLPRILERLVDWLQAWNLGTRVTTTLDTALLERELLAPARALALPDPYLTWLGERCSAAEGVSIPLVAAHNDLTSANVLVASGRLGIVDWDTAERRTLPLTDLFYALADFQAASERFADRTAAFLACFARNGDAVGRAADHERQLADALALPPDVADLCFHACWLRHAGNEAMRPASAPRPFEVILRAVAEQQLRMS